MPRVQTVEQTGKIWKLSQMVGVLGILGGASVIIARMNGYGSSELAVWAGVALAGGVGLWIGGRLGAWWFHG